MPERGTDPAGANRHRLAEVIAPEAVVVVVSGPGGVGKGTIVERVVGADPRLHLNRSWTTRKRRPGEDPDAYRFVSREDFEAHVEGGGFIEWVEFLDYLQGSPLPEVPWGHDVLFEIDVAGGAAIAEMVEDPLLVFIDAPDRATQADRMRARGDSDADVERRLRHAGSEVEAASELPYVTVVNDDLDSAVQQVRDLIEQARAARRGDPSPA